MNKSPANADRPSRGRYPRARADLRFQPAATGLSLNDLGGRQSGPLSLTAALVLTYCDGRHDPVAIAEAVAEAIASGRDADVIRADVHRIIQGFASDGIVD